MNITRIEIEEFGKLQGLSFTPSAGMNLVEGANESGKSTLLAFIRFMFYGFPRRGIKDFPEDELRLSFAHRLAAGKLRFSLGGNEYEISRRYFLHGTGESKHRTETCTVFNCTAQEEIQKTEIGKKSIGEYFLGLPYELFDSSLCVRQSDIDRVGADGMGDLIGEVLGAASNQSFKSADARLDAARKTLALIRGRGGKIAEYEDRLFALREDIRAAESDAAKLAEMRSKLSELREKKVTKKKELAMLQQQIDYARLATEARSFADLHQSEQTVEMYRARLEAASKAAESSTRLDASLSEATALLANKRIAQAKLADARLEKEQHSDEMRTAAPLLSLAERMRAAGGARDISDRLRSLQSRRGSTLFLTIFTATLSPLSLIGCFFEGLFPYAILLAAVLASFGLTFYFIGRSYKKKRLRLLESLGARDRSVTAESLIAAEAESARLQQRSEALDAAYARFEAEDNALSCTLSSYFSTVFGHAFTTVDQAEAELREHSRQAGSNATAVAAAQEALRRAVESKNALAERLTSLNEADILQKLSELQGTIAPTDTAAAVSAYERTNAALGETEVELSELERAEAALSTTVIDVSSAEAEATRITATLEAARAQLRAVTMAKEALSDAAAEIREHIAPALGTRASEIFRILTGGAHDTFFLANDLSITTEAEGAPRAITFFSAGCRDAAYLALRLSILERLSDDALPLLFDEALARLDDDRAATLLSLLLTYCESGRQCILFTCHTREAAFFEASGTPVTKLKLS